MLYYDDKILGNLIPGSQFERILHRYYKPMLTINKGAVLDRDGETDECTIDPDWDRKLRTHLETLPMPFPFVQHLSLEWVKWNDVEREGIPYWRDHLESFEQVAQEYGTSLYAFFHYHKGAEHEKLLEIDSLPYHGWDCKWRHKEDESWTVGVDEVSHGCDMLAQAFPGVPQVITVSFSNKVSFDIEGGKATKAMAKTIRKATTGLIPNVMIWEAGSVIADPSNDKVLAKRARQFAQSYLSE